MPDWPFLRNWRQSQRTVLVQSLMRSPGIVGCNIFLYRSVQMPFIEDDYLIQAFLPADFPEILDSKIIQYFEKAQLIFGYYGGISRLGSIVFPLFSHQVRMNLYFRPGPVAGCLKCLTHSAQLYVPVLKAIEVRRGDTALTIASGIQPKVHTCEATCHFGG